MGGCPVLEGLYKIAELCVGLLHCKAQRLEHPLLQISVRNSDTASTQFHTVQYQVIGLSPYLTRIRFKHGLVLILRCGKGVMGSYITLLVLIVDKQGPIHNPEEVVGVLIN